MLHEPAAQQKNDYAVAFKQRLGVWMFLLYAIVYGGFVAINIIKPTLMEKTIMLGLNLAVVYGFGLIIFALVLAMIYNHICTGRETKLREADTAGEGN